nr:NifB/NifX family molybdenum-iron cluster-binding protein [uncultured Methanolobus sp.]
MKICVTAKGSDLDASVDPHFGRCNSFLVVDSETMDFQSIENDQGSASGGAGIQAAQQVIGNGINVLITGSVGPNAFSLLESENIEMKIVSGGSVKEAIEAYKAGSLEGISAPNSAGKSGK